MSRNGRWRARSGWIKSERVTSGAVVTIFDYAMSTLAFLTLWLIKKAI